MRSMLHKLFVRSGRSRRGSILRVVAAAGCALALAGCGSEAPAAARPAETPGSAAPGSGLGVASANPSSPTPATKSVFHIDPSFGRDPFFPGSRRDLAQGSSAAQTPQLPMSSYLKLVGIRPGTRRPMALINRSPVTQGEQVDVTIVVTNQFNKAEVQKVGIRCLEIRRDSVLISIAGEQGVKELHMAQAH